MRHRRRPDTAGAQQLPPLLVLAPHLGLLVIGTQFLACALRFAEPRRSPEVVSISDGLIVGLPHAVYGSPYRRRALDFQRQAVQR